MAEKIKNPARETSRGRSTPTAPREAKKKKVTVIKEEVKVTKTRGDAGGSCARGEYTCAKRVSENSPVGEG